MKITHCASKLKFILYCLFRWLFVLLNSYNFIPLNDIIVFTFDALTLLAWYFILRRWLIFYFISVFHLFGVGLPAYFSSYCLFFFIVKTQWHFYKIAVARVTVLETVAPPNYICLCVCLISGCARFTTFMCYVLACDAAHRVNTRCAHFTTSTLTLCARLVLVQVQINRRQVIFFL